MSDPILFDADHTFETGEWIAFESGGLRQTAKVEALENNLTHLWLHVSNPAGFSSVLLRGMSKRHCLDARRVTERGLTQDVALVIESASPAIRQRTRVRT